MRTKKLKGVTVTFLAALLIAAIALMCTGGMSVFNKTFAQSANTVVFGFNNIYDSAWGESTSDKGEFLRCLANPSNLSLTSDENSAENQAIKFVGGEYGTWPEGDVTVEQWGSTNDSFNNASLNLADYKSMYLNFYVSDFSAVRLVKLNIGTNAANSYELQLGNKGKHILTQNGWQTLKLNLTELTVNGTLAEGVSPVGLHLEVFTSSATAEVAFSEIGLSPDIQDATLFDFNSFASETAPHFAKWDSAAYSLTTDNNGKAGEAIKIIGYDNGNDFVSDSNIMNVNTGIKTSQYKSIYADLKISDRIKIRAIEVSLAFEHESGAPTKGYKFTLTPSMIKSNDWVKVGLNIDSLTKIGAPEGNESISLIKFVTFATEDNVEINFAKLALSPNEVALEKFSGLEFNEIDTSSSVLVWNGFHENLKLSENEQNEANSAWLFQAGAGNQALNYVLDSSNLADEHNAMTIKFFVDKIEKLRFFTIRLSYDLGEGWAGYSFDVFKAADGSGWQTATIKIPKVTTKTILGLFISISNGDTAADGTDVKIDYIRPATVSPSTLDSCERAGGNIMWNGLNINLAQDRDGNESAWRIPAGTGADANANIAVQYPTDMTDYNAIAIKLKAINPAAVNHLIFKLTADDTWNGYTFDIKSSLTGEWQTVYVYFNQMSITDNDNNPIPSAATGITMMNIKCQTGADVILENLEFVTVPEIALKDDNKALSKTDETIDLKTFITAADADGVSFSYSVKQGENDITVTNGVFEANSEGKYAITIRATEGEFNVVFTTSFTLDKTAPVIAEAEYIVTEGMTASAANFFTVTDALSSKITCVYTVEKNGQALAFDDGTLNFNIELADYKVKVAASDEAGNVSEYSKTFTVSDTTPPVLTVPLTAVNKNVGDTIDLTALVSAEDAVSPSNKITFAFSVKLGITSITLGDGKVFTPLKGGTYLVTVTAKDELNNTSEAKTFTVTVPDSVKPVISGLDGINKTGETGTKITLAGISATDDVAASCNVKLTVKLGGEIIALDDEKSFTPTKAGTYTVTVEATDGINSESTSFDIVVTQKKEAKGACATFDFTLLFPTLILLIIASGALLFAKKKAAV